MYTLTIIRDEDGEVHVLLLTEDQKKNLPTDLSKIVVSKNLSEESQTIMNIIKELLRDEEYCEEDLLFLLNEIVSLSFDAGKISRWDIFETPPKED